MHESHTDIWSEADVAVATTRVNRMLSQQGLRAEDISRIITVVSELARNIVKYAGRGELLASVSAEQGRSLVRIKALDRGPGIQDLDTALADGFSTGGTLGMGLPGVRRLMDTFEIQSTLGVGTQIVTSRWVGQR